MDKNIELRKTAMSILLVTHRMRKNLYRLMAEANIKPCQMMHTIFPDKKLIWILLDGAKYLRIPCDSLDSSNATYGDVIHLLNYIETRCNQLCMVLDNN